MKTFLEVFPDLHIADSVRGLLELVKVEKVTATSDRSSVRIYIDSPRLMHKQNIYMLEDGIREQLFPGKRITIRIRWFRKDYILFMSVMYSIIKENALQMSFEILQNYHK